MSPRTFNNPSVPTDEIVVIFLVGLFSLSLLFYKCLHSQSFSSKADTAKKVDLLLKKDVYIVPGVDRDTAMKCLRVQAFASRRHSHLNNINEMIAEATQHMKSLRMLEVEAGLRDDEDALEKVRSMANYESVGDVAAALDRNAWERECLVTLRSTGNEKFSVVQDARVTELKACAVTIEELNAV